MSLGLKAFESGPSSENLIATFSFVGILSGAMKSSIQFNMPPCLLVCAQKLYEEFNLCFEESTQRRIVHGDTLPPAINGERTFRNSCDPWKESLGVVDIEQVTVQTRSTLQRI